MAAKRKRSQRGIARNNSRPAVDRKRLRQGGRLLVFLAGVILTIFAFLLVGGNFGQKESESFRRDSISRYELYAQVPESRVGSEIRSLNQLLSLSAEELEKVDIGLMNLLCAEGLPGAEGLDIAECLERLDYWAEYVKAETDKRIWYFDEDPVKYKYSKGLCRMSNLGLTLKKRMGVHYNMANLARVDFSDSREIFIHGPLMSRNHGSCTNLPVLGIAIARRLGYPVKLVATSEHYFIRWEDNKTGERFNIELACNGVGDPDDEHYKNWPQKLNELDFHEGYLLKSLTAGEELAAFLHLRGDVLTDLGRIAEAQVTYAQAYRLLPNKTVHLVSLAATVDRELERLARNDCLALKSRICYTVSRSTEADDMADAWIYRYPKAAEAIVVPVAPGTIDKYLQQGNKRGDLL